MSNSVTNEICQKWQCDQFQHDKRNHSDMSCLHKNDRLKHYGLHYSKYVGRLARGKDENTPTERTMVDAALVCLSAANTLSQRLESIEGGNIVSARSTEALHNFADIAGRFADACEKIDHLESFLEIAKESNQKIFAFIISAAIADEIDLHKEMKIRRKQLAERLFFIRD